MREISTVIPGLTVQQYNTMANGDFRVWRPRWRMNEVAFSG